MTQFPPLKLSTRVRRAIGWAAVLPFGFLYMSSSWADTCTGYEVATLGPNETTDFGHGLKQIRLKSQPVLLSDNSLYNLLVGECVGAMLQTPDGKTQSSGYCVRHDKAGDSLSTAWSQAPGADKGEWHATGGTGKYAGRQDSGWWQVLHADAKVYVSKWGGNCR
jgi:hypothetical protein